jgi:hypothetical protein
MIDIEGPPTLPLYLVGDSDPSMAQTPAIEPLLFGLSLAAALPPTAILVPAGSPLPIVRSDPQPILSPADLTSILGRPMEEIGRGRVALGEVDRRLHRLIVSLDVFRATDGSGVLVSLGIIRVDPAATTVAGATPLDLWSLAAEPLSHHGVAVVYPIRVGDRARVVVYGGITAQVAWLSGERLTTASVTSLAGDDAAVMQAASAIALALECRR